MGDEYAGSTVYVGGVFEKVGDQVRRHLAAIDAATATVTGWNPDADHTVSAMAVQHDTIYVTGGFSHIGGQEHSYVAAIDATTGLATPWTTHYSPSSSPIFGLAVSDSTVYVADTYNTILAFDKQTGVQTSWNPKPDGVVHALAVSGNTVYASGSFKNIGGQARDYIAALDATTGLATNWNPRVGWQIYKSYPNDPYGLLLTSGSNVYIGGPFTTIGGVERNNLAAIDATTGLATAWNPNADNSVYTMLIHGPTLYLGGEFQHIGAQARNHLASVDLPTNSLTSWNPDTDGYIATLAATDTTIYAAGPFTSVNGQPRRSLAAIDATSSALTDWKPEPDNVVDTLVVSGSVVFAGGYFTTIGGQERNGLAALDTTSGNATNWDAQPTLDAYGSIEALTLQDNTLYVGGEFTSIGGQPRKNLAALDATTGSATLWNPVSSDDVVGYVAKLVVHRNVLYIAGGYIRIDDQPLNHVVALDTRNGVPIAWGPAINGNPLYNIQPIVQDLVVDGATVYIGGQWRTIGTEVRSGFAALLAVTPLVQTGAATNVATTSATLPGRAETYGLPTTLGFAYTTASGDYSHAEIVPATTAAISGTTTMELRADLTHLAPGTTYYYRAVATSEDDTNTGDEQSFTTPALPQPPATVPTIVTQPTDVAISPGTSVTLTVAVSGTAPFSYQWYAGQSGDTRTPIAGATTSSFTPPASSATTAYWVRVGNTAGSVDSSTVMVRVVAAPTQRFVLYLPTMRTS